MTIAAGLQAEAADVNNIIFHRNSVITPFLSGAGIPGVFGILAHSSTTWTVVGAASTLRTTDSGVTWVAPTSGADTDMRGSSSTCDADKTRAIVCDNNSNEVNFTTDSGDNWANATTPPLNATRALDITYPTTAIALVALDVGTATRGIFRSTDGGDTWAAVTTGPTVDVHAIDMLDGTTGYAIDVDENIWKTTDGGVNWTDAGNNVTTSQPADGIFVIDATTFLHNAYSGIGIAKYTSSGATEVISLGLADGIGNFITNIIKSTNGNIYCIIRSREFGASTFQTSANILSSTDSGGTWVIGVLPNIARGIFAGGDDTFHLSKSTLVEYDTDKFIMALGEGTIMLLDETNNLSVPP